MYKLEFLLHVALNKCLADRDGPTDIVHLYFNANGMDFNFCFNPSGVHVTTLGTILDQFAAMIQKGKNVFIDESTRLYVMKLNGSTPTR